MNRDFVILTDSSCDLTHEMAEQLGVPIIPLTLQLGDTSYRNWLDGRDIDTHTFYERLRAGENATTSAVNVGDFEATWNHFLRQGKDVLYLCFSSGLSSTYQSACIAAKSVLMDYPKGRVEVVDTLCASLGQGLLTYLCAKEKEQGKSLDEVRDFAEETKFRLCHWFTVDDLNHLKRGGRVSATAAFFGTMMSVKPVLHMDDEGHLIPMSKTRGRKASLLALADQMEQLAVDPAHQTIFISHGDCEADARFLADEITRRFGVTDIHINYVGPVIGSHTGPGVMALFFIGEHR